MNERLKETLARIASAVVALPAYFFIIYTDSFQSVPILILSVFVSLICLYEFYLIAEKDGQRPFVSAGMIMSVLANILMYLFAYGRVYGYEISGMDARYLLALLVALIVVLSLLQLFRRPIPGGIYSMAVTIFGIMLIVIPFAHIILLKSLKDGVFYIIIMNLTVMLNDAAAYFGGVLFGKHKTGFPVSPNKSWEGYFFGLLFSVLAMIIINQLFISFFNRHLFGVIEAAIIGIFLSLIASIGDLIESLVKRDGAIKDSGSIIPGHGGMWDAFDAMIFSMPLFYYYLSFKGVP
jgi:phosphatidate cytidylyltransferase